MKTFRQFTQLYEALAKLVDKYKKKIEKAGFKFLKKYAGRFSFEHKKHSEIKLEFDVDNKIKILVNTKSFTKVFKYTSLDDAINKIKELEKEIKAKGDVNKLGAMLFNANI